MVSQEMNLAREVLRKLGSRAPTFEFDDVPKFGLALFAILVMYYGCLFFSWSHYPEIYFRSMLSLGVFAWKSPFLDAIAVLSWSDCHHAGINVLLSNPCDPLDRPLGYSPVLLDLPLYWLGVRNAIPVGIGLDFAFLITLPFTLRPAAPRAFLIATMACFSPSVVYALERGNLDVFCFILIAGSTLCATKGRAPRLVSYWFYLAVGLLKFYPLVLLGLIVRERPRFALTFGFGAITILIALGAHYWSVLMRTLPPVAHGTMAILTTSHYLAQMFGGLLLPFGVADFFRLPHTVGVIMFVALLIVTALGAVSLARRFKPELSVADWDRPNCLLLVVGAVLIVGCFVAGPSLDYRAIFLLLVIPGLLELQSRTRNRGVSLVGHYAVYAVLLCLWQQFIEISLIRFGIIDPNLMSGLIFLLVREMVWWGLVCILTALIGIYVLQTLLWHPLRIGRVNCGVE